MTARDARKLRPGTPIKLKGEDTEYQVMIVCNHRGSKGECHIFLRTDNHLPKGPYLPGDLEK